MYKEASSAQVEFYTKIQEATPSHLSTLPNKQVGYMVHVQSDKLYKLKNCIDSARSNSELYKKFSKKFSSNMKKNQNQLVVCCGFQQKSRIQTSIGLKKNPGIFMIAGIGVLDQKYQQDHKNFDVEISFIEYKEGKFYDLLCYTKQALKISKKNEEISFGQSYFKITTFSQFLKLFKIALFNNKERDLKTNCKNQDSKIKSSLIMTIMIKTYNNGKFVVQKTSLIDFSMEEPVFGQKSQWDYFTIELNNMTGRKKQYYHLVESNPLIQYINYHLKSGDTFILNSISSNPQHFPKNYQFICEYEGIVGQITQRSEQQEKNTQIVSQSSLRTQLFSLFQNLNNLISSRKYSSLRQYREIKHEIIQMLKISKNYLINCLKALTKLLQNKRKIRLGEHCLLADQLRLIGSCVKTDHYKDFYQAKSYLSLQRQVSIKTDQTKKILKTFLKQRQSLKQKFHDNKSHYLQQASQFFDSHHENQTQTSKNTETNAALSITDHNNEIKNAIRSIIRKILELENKIYNNLIFTCKRTNADEIIREEQLIQQTKHISRQIQKIQQDLNSLVRTGKIQFELSENIQDAHLTMLVRQMKNIIKKDRFKKIMPKQTAKIRNIYNKQKIKGYQQIQTAKQFKLNENKTKFTKLPSIQKQNLYIGGHLSLRDMLIDPSFDLS